MPASPYEQLEQEFRRLHAFRGALSLLRWDAAVMMPRGSADVRGEQLAALETEHHALLTPRSWRIGRSPICTRCAASAITRLRRRRR
jgi:Zn-dependent M32 family carboxypeptidase